MRYWASFLCYLLTTFSFAEQGVWEKLTLSTPDQLANLTSASNYLIGGLISPLDGHPVLRKIDLIVKGAQEITLSRIYTPPYISGFFAEQKDLTSYKGWQFLPHLRLQLDPQLMQVRLCEPNGVTLDFSLSGPDHSVTTLASPSYVISNALGDIPSGKHDLRNTTISYEENGDKITVHAMDGTTRAYYKEEPITNLYLLKKETLPNGKILKYHYNQKYQPICIESLDPKERYIYASLRITGSPIEGSCCFTSSSGTTANYSYQKRTLDHNSVVLPPILTSVDTPFYPKETINYCDRLLIDSYSGKNDIFTLHHTHFGHIPHYRIHKLSVPNGQNHTLYPIYQLDYQPPDPGKQEGKTIVTESNGSATIYYFSKNALLTSVQYLGQDGLLKKEKILSWDTNNWLQEIQIRDNQQKPLYKKSYQFDAFGNPTVETITGDLTGKGKQESYIVNRKFSQDGRNLLLEEKEEDGVTICLSYLPNTNLVTSKLTKNNQHILLREFFTYDDCNNLIQTMIDDGETVDKNNLLGMTQRTITNYTLRQQPPFLHMPEWIEEKYLQHGKEELLQRSHLTYDSYGNIAQQEIYGSNNHLAYVILKEYNERGDLLSETNPLQQKANYQYDEAGRLYGITSFSNNIQKTIHYDIRGRPIQQIEEGNDGITHTTHLGYDPHDRLIQKTDAFHNTTRYTYDPLVNQIIKTGFPSCASVDNQAITVSTSSTYDPFGRALTKTDANGNTTSYRYNAYGFPTKITHPNGNQERLCYKKNGLLESRANSDGLTTYYTYDLLGRILSKTYTSSQEETVAEETFTYSSFHLLTHTNKQGQTQKYLYDGAGRKIREEFCGKIIDFSYDSLGRLETIHKHNGNNTLVIHYKRDLADRVLQKSKTDILGNILYKISYSYDQDGNQKTITRYINGKKAIDAFTYDSFCRLTMHQNANSDISTITYNENHSNSLGQKVLQISTTDPHNITTIETQDAFGRLSNKKSINSHGAVLSKKEIIYDPHGNLTYQKDHIYEAGLLQNTQTIRYTYTANHQIKTLTRGFGTKNQKKTTYTYWPSGKIKTKTLPDNITLTYEYHPLGFLKKLYSSDNRINHIFHYDKLGRLQYALDQNQSIAIHRDIDPFGNIIRETLPCGFEIKKKYDYFHRLTHLILANQGKITYTYDPLFLRSIERASSDGNILYKHTYEDYDLDGNLLLENTIGNLGKTDHSTDLIGRKTATANPYFSQQCNYDAIGNLIKNSIDGKENHYSYDNLSQLSSENQSLTYTYDSLYNRTSQNTKKNEIDALNQLLSNNYDANGNQTSKTTPDETIHLHYDPLNRLIEASSEKQKSVFTYDPLGRRVSKIDYIAENHKWKKTTQQHYLYHGQEEIGACLPNKELLNLRVISFDTLSTISIEIGNKIFAPILDIQGNIRRLISLNSKTIADSYNFTAFGQQLEKGSQETSNPWRFASKRLDPEWGLIYFGKRYYDPASARWTTTDPAGCTDSANPYQYVLNNPFKYQDPRGESVIGLLCGIGEILLGGTIMATGVAIEIGTFGGYTIAFGLHESAGLALMTHGCAHAMYHSKDISLKKRSSPMWKNTDVYAPNRPLPRGKHGVFAPDTDAPHTQLGIKESKRKQGESYPQAREFDKDGKPVRDIDFTDHGRPHEHPNPHQHRYEENPTGGTLQRSKNAEPVSGWKY